jgi:hypothetical protein
MHDAVGVCGIRFQKQGIRSQKETETLPRTSLIDTGKGKKF